MYTENGITYLTNPWIRSLVFIICTLFLNFLISLYMRSEVADNFNKHRFRQEIKGKTLFEKYTLCFLYNKAKNNVIKTYFLIYWMHFILVFLVCLLFILCTQNIISQSSFLVIYIIHNIIIICSACVLRNK